MHPLSALLRPASIVLVGASPDASKLGGRPLAYLRRYGFQGKVFAVNPKYTEIDGTPCFPSVADLPPGIDLALILLPASGVPEALEACGRRGIRCAISIAGGFAEAGDSAAQERLAAICREHGIRLIGPNCVGAMNPALGMTATFSSELRNRMPRPGRLALFTQSGALGNALLQSFNDLDLGVAYWVSTGNEADVGLLDLVEFALEDDKVNLIALYVEGLKQGERLLDLARRAHRQGKAIVALRAGRSQLGRAAAVSHTGKLAGAWKVWRDVTRQAGLITVDTLEEMLDVAIAFDSLGFPRPDEIPGLGVLTISGGMGVLVSDAAADHALPLPPFSGATQAALRSLLPPQMSVANPVDTALFTDEKGFAACAEAVLRDELIGVLLIVMTRLAHDYQATLPWLESLAAQAGRAGKCVAVSYLSPSDPFEREARLRLMRAGVLVLPTPGRVVEALGRRHGLRRPQPAMGVSRAPDGGAAASSSRSTQDFLQQAGVPPLPVGVFREVDEAAAFARAQGYPVVLKVVSLDIPHKTEAGGVALDLNDEAALRHAWTRMVASVQTHAPGARIDGYAVQPMVRDGFDLIVGCSIDPELGKVLMVGAGGIWAEVLEDVRFLALPASREEIEDALQGLRIAPILAGARGHPPLDVAEATRVIYQLSRQFLLTEAVQEVDINPLRLRARGKGVVALDTLVVPKP